MRIEPEETTLTQEYWEGMRQGRIMVQRCAVCDIVWHPPEPTCPSCQSSDIEWVPLSGRGTVYSYTWVNHAAHVAFRDDLPYLIVTVDLEEGPRIVSTIPDQPYGPVEIGMPVTAVFPDDADGGLLKFVPATS